MKSPIFKTIRFRLTFAYSLILLLGFFLSALYFYHGLKANAEKEILSILEREFVEMSRFISENFNQRNLIIHELNQRTTLSGERYKLYYSLFDAEGMILAKSESFAEDSQVVNRLRERLHANVLPAEGRRIFSHRTGYADNPVALWTDAVWQGPRPIYFLQLGVSVLQIHDAIWKYFFRLLLIIPALLTFSALGGYFLASRYLRPVVDITRRAQEMTIKSLGGHLPVRNTGDELDELAATFNALFDRLAKSYQRISQFTQDASHELRIPLTTLKGEAQVVLGRERNAEEYRRVLESSVEEYERLSRMLNDLLMLSRLDMESQALSFEPVDLSELLTKMCDFFHVAAEAKGTSLEREIDSSVIISGNRVMLERLFSNILDNAIKYTLNGKPIMVSLKSILGKPEVRVKDQGLGIPADCREKIFDRFYRVDKSRSRELGGAGLGLSIAKVAAEMHQAKIEIESEEGKGTEVWIRF